KFLGAFELAQTFGKFPFCKKVNPPEGRMCFSQPRCYRDRFLAILAGRCPGRLYIASKIANQRPRFRTFGISQRVIWIEADRFIVVTNSFAIILEIPTLEIIVAEQISVMRFLIPCWRIRGRSFV